MKSVELVIRGSKVIGVGYRPFLLLNAMYLGAERFFAFNARKDDKETVIVRVQGDDGNIIQYIEFAKANFPEHASVDEVIERNYEGPLMDIDKFLQLLQFEQISKAVPAIISIDKKQDIMIEKQDIMIEKQDIMIGKQDLTIAILGNIKEDTSAIKNEISALRKDTSDMLYEKYEQLSREIADIKAALSEMKAKAS